MSSGNNRLLHPCHPGCFPGAPIMRAEDRKRERRRLKQQAKARHRRKR